MEVKYVFVNGETTSNEIEFDVVVHGDVCFKEVTRHNDEEGSCTKWFRLNCQATLDGELKNFTVLEVEPYDKKQNHFQRRLSDALVPIISKRLNEMQLQRLNHCKGESVPALVWQITPNDEKALDRYEGWPHLYRKETIKVKVDKKTVNAMVYIMNEGRPLEQPSCYYYSTILEGYKSAGFDTEYLRKAVEYSYEKDGATLENESNGGRYD